MTEEAKKKNIEDLSMTELKAALFDIDQEIKQRQNVYQQVGIQLEKKVKEEQLKNTLEEAKKRPDVTKKVK